MPEINLDKVVRDIRTGLFYGPYGAGKTHLCCTFPDVAWFGAKREGGFDTIASMRKDDFFEERRPRAFVVNTFEELRSDLKNTVVPLIKRGVIKTVAVETSFYADDVLHNYKGDGKNQWAKYQFLDEHFRWLDRYAKGFGVRLVYNALAAAADDLQKTPSGILMPGRAIVKKLPAGVSIVGYMRRDEDDRVLHLSDYGPYPARHRFRDRLPNIIRNPTYQKLLDLLNGKVTVDKDGYVVPLDSTALDLRLLDGINDGTASSGELDDSLLNDDNDQQE